MNKVLRPAFVTMSHVRDIYVLHKGGKVIFDIPLYMERGIIFKEARIESGRMIIEAVKKFEDLGEKTLKNI